MRGYVFKVHSIKPAGLFWVYWLQTLKKLTITPGKGGSAPSESRDDVEGTNEACDPPKS